MQHLFTHTNRDSNTHTHKHTHTQSTYTAKVFAASCCIVLGLLLSGMLQHRSVSASVSVSECVSVQEWVCMSVLYKRAIFLKITHDYTWNTTVKVAHYEKVGEEQGSGKRADF